MVARCGVVNDPSNNRRGLPQVILLIRSYTSMVVWPLRLRFTRFTIALGLTLETVRRFLIGIYPDDVPVTFCALCRFKTDK